VSAIRVIRTGGLCCVRLLLHARPVVATATVEPVEQAAATARGQGSGKGQGQGQGGLWLYTLEVGPRHVHVTALAAQYSVCMVLLLAWKSDLYEPVPPHFSHDRGSHMTVVLT
jgi:hypothetical protein